MDVHEWTLPGVSHYARAMPRMNQGWRILSGRATGSSESRLDSPRVVFSGPIDPAGPPPRSPSPDPEHAPFAFAGGIGAGTRAVGAHRSVPPAQLRPADLARHLRRLRRRRAPARHAGDGAAGGLRRSVRRLARGRRRSAVDHAVPVHLLDGVAVHRDRAARDLDPHRPGGLTVAHPRLVSDLFLLCAAASIPRHVPAHRHSPLARPCSASPSRPIRSGRACASCCDRVPGRGAGVVRAPAHDRVAAARSDAPAPEKISLESELVGYILLALSRRGVHDPPRRPADARAPRAALDPPEHLAVGRDRSGRALRLQHRRRLAAADLVARSVAQRPRRSISPLASGLGMGRVLLLGASAGIGEEITLRGRSSPSSAW